MNTDYENKAYPCDEPEAKKPYPCDTEEAFSIGGKASGNTGAGAYTPESEPHVPGNTGDMTRTGENGDGHHAGGDGELPLSERKGKGRRGGNAAASKVIHSGTFRERRSMRRDEATGGRRGEYGDRPRRDDAFDNTRSGFERGDRHDRFDRQNDRQRDDRRERFDRGNDRQRDDRRRNRPDDRDGRRNHPDGRGDRRTSRSGATASPSPESILSRAYATYVARTSEVGAFVPAPEELRDSIYGSKIQENGLILLPFAEQLGRPQRGEEVNVFFYEDKGGRLAATMRAPILRDGEIGVLTVAAVTRIGAFLDNGVPKQILLPFSEQIVRPDEGDEVLVYVYSDKSGRQAATMRVYSHLEKHSPYQEDDRVTGFVYEINPKLGIFVAVDNKYYGLVPIRETFKEYAYGDEIEARVARVREDGKLDLLIRDKLYKTVQEDAEVILYELRRNNGLLPYGDRADAAFIEETYAMSKNQFKRALGHLYKNKVVELDRSADTVRLIPGK